MNENPTTQEDFKQGITPINIEPYKKQYDVKEHAIFKTNTNILTSLF